MGLKDEGEALAKLALEKNVKRGQLRKLYTRVMSRPTDDVEAFIKYQTQRVYGFNFGERLLGIFEKYRSEIEKFQEVLKYAIMLYDYMDAKEFMDLKPKIRKVAERECKRYGLIGVEPLIDRGKKKIDVALSDFNGSSRKLSGRLKSQILRSIPEVSGHYFKVWIKKRR